MLQKTPKIIAIVGPTASGKSDLAVELAKKFNGEVISADSRQVYKGLNIGTGKITKREMRGISHHLLDIADPRRQYSVTRYQKEAARVLSYMIVKGKVPIICGGTGFYIDAILKNRTFPKVPPNKKLREQLSKKPTIELFKILKKIDSARAKTIDAKNPVRLIRAIEIAKALGKVPALPETKNTYETLTIGIKTPNETLKKRIHARLLKRINQGMIEEAKRLHKHGLSWKRMDSLGLEYRYLAKYLQDEITKEKMIEQTLTESWRYAKRQKRWFKRDKNIVWFPLTSKGKIESMVKKFLLHRH